MRNPVIFMFSGQGSQYRQMGRALYESQPCFREWLLKGDQLVQDMVSLSVLEEMYTPENPNDDTFNQIIFTYPAVFLVEYALAQLLLQRGIRPDYVLGVSMGSFAALAVAGVLSFEQALQAVINQAVCFETYCQTGNMIAILNRPTMFSQTPWLYQQSALAGINFNKHFVIATPHTNWPEIRHMLKQTSTVAQKLSVSHAFHSPWIDAAEHASGCFLQNLSYHTAQIPFICCSNSTEMMNIPKNYLWNVIREPIQFQKTITDLEANHAWRYLDLGPSGTLATFVKYNLAPASMSDFFMIMTPAGQELRNLEKLSAAAFIRLEAL